MSNLRTNVEPFSRVTVTTDILGLSRPTIHQPEGVVCLAVTKRGLRIWEPLHDLSGANWVQLRDVIEEQVRLKLLEGLNRTRLSTLPIAPTAPSYCLGCTQWAARSRHRRTTMKDFYTALFAKDPQTAKLLLRKHTGPTGLNRRVCVSCFQWKGLGHLGPRCIHRDCPGMCDECYSAKEESKRGDTCRVCARKDERDCPVCLETKPAEEFNPSETCSHHVCFKCCFRAERSGNPIRSCPLCRQDFAPCQNYAPAWPSNTTGPTTFSDVSGNITSSTYAWLPNDPDNMALDYVSEEDINRIATALFQ